MSSEKSERELEAEQTARGIDQMVILVTGASRGIGAAIALRLAELRPRFILQYHQSHERMNEVARACQAKGAQVLTVSADLSNADDIDKLQERWTQYGWQPDILINNAAIAHYGMIQDVTPETYDAVMALNVRAPFVLAQRVLPYMVRQRFGKIINISSVWGASGASCEVLYSMSKGAINTFTKALAKEVAPSGVSVNAVAPGVVDTEMVRQFNEQEKAALSSEIPMGRFASPQEIAATVYFLAIPESSYITGQIISPNGGWIT